MLDGSAPYLQRRPANFQPLTPVDFLKRSVSVYPRRPAIIDGAKNWTYAEIGEFTGRFAAALLRDGLGRGDVVSILSPNRPELLAAHFAVPMAGAVLNALNIRLDAAAIAYILAHCGSRLLIADQSCAALAREAARLAGLAAPLIIIGGGENGERDFGRWLEGVAPAPLTADHVLDEWQPIAINYTSGTTGKPKGVVYHHRGAYLNAIGNVLALGFGETTRYLWTLPMFHCNGWCHPWAVTAAGGTHICLERPDPALIFAEIARNGATHFACAPVVLYMMLDHPARPQGRLGQPLRAATGGAAPTAALIAALDAMGIELIHLYGLTESYGPATLCAPREEWGEVSIEEKAALLARQGFRHHLGSEVGVVLPDGSAAAADGAMLGEITLRGNTLMAGYYRDEAATDAAFAGGVFHTGDLAVRHGDGSIEIKDRAKDIIISGGENISSLEVESVLHRHPAILLAAVVAAPDPKWGEAPHAFVELRAGAAPPSAEELTAFCRQHLAGFKVPRCFAVGEIPKTSTGKVQKFALRARASLPGKV
jgi:fatty-acyl-CoA synthase